MTQAESLAKLLAKANIENENLKKTIKEKEKIIKKYETILSRLTTIINKLNFGLTLINSMVYKDGKR